MRFKVHEFEVSLTIGGDPPVKLPGVVFQDGRRVVRTSHGDIVIAAEPDHVDVYQNGGSTAQVYAHDQSAGRTIDTVSHLGPESSHLCYYLGPGGQLTLANRTGVFVQVKRR